MLGRWSCRFLLLQTLPFLTLNLMAFPFFILQVDSLTMFFSKKRGIPLTIYAHNKLFLSHSNSVFKSFSWYFSELFSFLHCDCQDTIIISYTNNLLNKIHTCKYILIYSCLTKYERWAEKSSGHIKIVSNRANSTNIKL